MSHELDPQRASKDELEARGRAAQAGVPFLVYRDAAQRQRIHLLTSRGPVTVGRTSEADVPVGWDDRVSRMHARLELVGDDPASDWTVVDDAPSRNGTFVNGKRVRGRARLSDGDRITFADTAMLFCAATARGRDTMLAPVIARGEGEAGPDTDSPTIVAGVRLTRESLTDGERRVLEALARPVRDSVGARPPASDEEVARETYLGVETIRRTLDGLCVRLGLRAFSEDEQRLLLVEHALRSGVLSQKRRED
jgi:pSer/pThr/pTyr-binding forkhead associated (FHA) protein